MGAMGAMGADHRLLEGVLGVLVVAQERPAVPRQRIAVPTEQGLEGTLVSEGDTAREAGVALGGEPGRLQARGCLTVITRSPSTARARAEAFLDHNENQK